MPFFAAMREIEREDRERYARLSSMTNVRNRFVSVEWAEFIKPISYDVYGREKPKYYKEPSMTTRRPKLYAGK